MLRSRCDRDDFLLWLHCLLSMDDTVILATSRDKAISKFQVLQDFCTSDGMVINQTKTKFMVINSDGRDKAAIVSNNVTVPYCTSYVYLGSIITDDEKFSTHIQEHSTEKRKHLNKFKLFLKKNPDIPFVVKERVFNACVISNLYTVANHGFLKMRMTLINCIWKALKQCWTCAKTPRTTPV